MLRDILDSVAADFVLSEIQLGFELFELKPGDSIAFDSTEPHRLFNLGEEPVHAIWFVVGRGADDRPTGIET